MTRLEIISRSPKRATGLPPLLFVHGAFCGAWIWDEHMLPYLVERGLAVHAVSLRGHGDSPGRCDLDRFGLDDYAADVETAIATLGGPPPVLVGHSMGGMVVQRAMERCGAAGAALMASAPPHGLWSSTWSLAWRHPRVFQQIALLQTFGPGAVDPSGIRGAFFSDRIPEADLLRFEPRMQRESRRVQMEMMGLRLPPRPPGVPVLVMGAEEDVFFPRIEIEATARAFGTQARIFPRMGHAMMLEPGWRDVADAIADWTAERFGGTRRAAS
ncbi:alpha/beta hydrolase [Arenibaculum pallidiluteum]|uniref:alpha/beta hydrolase n=1 Tax=Arenibaculum pallidiluteum TaxID=2812559 RepID=UPI001A978F4A|nr:alpha/beta fold hydrolase [Arenibaculum pallidiluteum]